MNERNKALFHSALALVSIAELFTSKSKLRSLLIGACAGWHIVAVHQHVFTKEGKK